jgi:hypothetical protein
MRRRPVAVYRVIDEEELLGGDRAGPFTDSPARHSNVPATDEAAPRRRFRPMPGWAPSALAVAGLVCLAWLLMTDGSHRRAAVPIPRAAPLPHPPTAAVAAPAGVAVAVRRAPRHRRSRAVRVRPAVAVHAYREPPVTAAEPPMSTFSAASELGFER